MVLCLVDVIEIFQTLFSDYLCAIWSRVVGAESYAGWRSEYYLYV